MKNHFNIKLENVAKSPKNRRAQYVSKDDSNTISKEYIPKSKRSSILKKVNESKTFNK